MYQKRALLSKSSALLPYKLVEFRHIQNHLYLMIVYYNSATTDLSCFLQSVTFDWPYLTQPYIASHRDKERKILVFL